MHTFFYTCSYCFLYWNPVPHSVNERKFHVIVYFILILYVGIFYLLVSTAKSKVHESQFYLLSSGSAIFYLVVTRYNDFLLKMLPFQGHSFIFRRGGIGGNHQENPRVDPGSGFQSWQPSKVHGFKRMNHPNFSFGAFENGGRYETPICKLYE